MTLVFFLPRGKDRRERKAFNFQRLATGTALKKSVDKSRERKKSRQNERIPSDRRQLVWAHHPHLLHTKIPSYLWKEFSSRIYHSGKDGLLGELWAWTSVGLFCRALLPPSACSDIVDRVQHLSTCARILPQAHTHTQKHDSIHTTSTQTRKHQCAHTRRHTCKHMQEESEIDGGERESGVWGWKRVKENVEGETRPTAWW